MNCSRVLLMTHPALIDELKTLVEPGKVLTDADSLNAFGKDWTKHFAPAPLAIVFPKSTEQVQAIVLWANERKVALVPSGGRTGLSAAAVAANGEVVVSFDYMNQVLDINLTDRTVVCQPGVVTEHLQNLAEENGLYYPVDFASAGSSQIGGNIGTNAGGIKVIRYGMTFAQLTNPAMQDKFAALFQTGWFIESMWTQTLVMHMIRTKKLPFIQSRASLPVMLLTMLGIAVVTLLPFTPLAAPLGLCALPPVYFAYLALIVLGYMVLATLMKKLYIRKYHELL